MRLSDQPEYKAAIPAALDGDFATARYNLRALMARADAEGDKASAGYLRHILGDIEAKAGNPTLGHSLHLEAIALDPQSPLSLLLYAQGLLRAFREPDLAKARLTEAKTLLGTSPPSDSNELPPEWYEKEFDELHQEIYRFEL